MTTLSLSSPQPSPSPLSPASPPRTFWPWLIIGLILLGMGGSLSMVVIAVRDPGFAVESDYYKKALLWDKTMAQEASNARLGWHLRASILPLADGSYQIRCHLLDHDRKPISKAKVELEAFFVARSARPLQTTMQETPEPGLYVAPLQTSYAGRWELRFAILADQKRFTFTDRLQIHPTTRKALGR